MSANFLEMLFELRQEGPSCEPVTFKYFVFQHAQASLF
jgi:hypothetical protein